MFMDSGGDLAKLLKNKAGIVVETCKPYWEETSEPKPGGGPKNKPTCPAGSPAPCMGQKSTPTP